MHNLQLAPCEKSERSTEILTAARLKKTKTKTRTKNKKTALMSLLPPLLFFKRVSSVVTSDSQSQMKKSEEKLSRV